MSRCKINSKPIGIYNIGNNCYLNSGLQILASCDIFVDELDKINILKTKNIVYYLKDAFDYLLNIKKTYEPSKFIRCFSEKNNDFILGTQCCSQDFIRTLIRNINEECIKYNNNLIIKNDQYTETNNKIIKEYAKFINNIYPESKIQSLFSLITKSRSKGECPYCRGKIDNYSFNFLIDQIIYLDGFEHKCKFSEILEENLGFDNNLKMDCPKCEKEIEIEEVTKIIKLPEILIFTLERYQGEPNKVKIEPDETLEMDKYIDKSLSVESTSYELFAINIRFGSTINYGHEICQVQRDGIWYEINDSTVNYKKNSHFDSSYGLFYRRKKKLKNDNLKTGINPIEAKSDETKINIKNSQIKINDSKQNINNAQKKIKDSQQNEKDSQKNIKKSQQNEQESQNKRDIENKTNKINNNEEITHNKETVNNIDNNKNNDIEAIDILKEVVINNIKNEDNFTQFKSYINNLYPNLQVSKCSQEIIIKILNELKSFNSKYKNYYYSNKAYSIFKVSLNYHYSYDCVTCKKIYRNYKKYDYYEPYYSPEFVIQLPKENSAKFKEILQNALTIKFYAKDKCIRGHSVNKYLTIEIDKLPKILIFTFKKKDKNNNIKITPDDTLNIQKDLYTSLKYKLFAINILKDEKSGNEFQININDKWYEIRNNNKLQIDKPNPSKYIIGLFYKKI